MTEQPVYEIKTVGEDVLCSASAVPTVRNKRPPWIDKYKPFMARVRGGTINMARPFVRAALPVYKRQMDTENMTIIRIKSHRYYLMDAITGTLYHESGRCVSSDDLTVTVDAKPNHAEAKRILMTFDNSPSEFLNADAA
jgi:hypothetical protein